MANTMLMPLRNRAATLIVASAKRLLEQKALELRNEADEMLSALTE